MKLQILLLLLLIFGNEIYMLNIFEGLTDYTNVGIKMYGVISHTKRSNEICHCVFLVSKTQLS